MSNEMTATVRDVVVAYPQAARILEKIGIDYCCGGGASFDQACAESGHDAEDVLNEIQAAQTPEEPATDWSTVPLASMIDHIVDVYHTPSKAEMERIQALANKVAGVHGGRHPELHEILHEFTQLRQEMTGHMMREELMLFPWVRRREAQARGREPLGAEPPFGKLEFPIRQMMAEHAASGDELRALRELSGNYQPPRDGCASYHALYAALAQFEADLHAHIHLENNFLFPRAVELEEGLEGGGSPKA